MSHDQQFPGPRRVAGPESQWSALPVFRATPSPPGRVFGTVPHASDHRQCFVSGCVARHRERSSVAGGWRKPAGDSGGLLLVHIPLTLTGGRRAAFLQRPTAAGRLPVRQARSREGKSNESGTRRSSIRRLDGFRSPRVGRDPSGYAREIVRHGGAHSGEHLLVDRRRQSDAARPFDAVAARTAPAEVIPKFRGTRTLFQTNRDRSWWFELCDNVFRCKTHSSGAGG